ncbi:MBL fold metallo-hydrolase [Flavobacterium sp.]|uniref:MBL fold metallo-hydrolase n=1 Tax=Flavobacterium sp. TaxID=239 RepID=UPI00286E9F33|nr:MBL fold metallo-hydrolase [Flavobacterium sp.]
MKIEQIYTGCLAQGAYYITSKDEAIIIDPLREIMPYRDRLKRDNVKLKYIFETHFHADFVSGHLDLSIQTGAKIVYGPNAATDFDFISASDGQLFDVGNIKVKAIHTPGHTMESTTFLLIDENGKDHAIFSGDTLFVGDVGRPDLAQKSASMSQDELAGILFDSLRTKIMTLNDDVIVYPAHGAGSACGKNMSKETVSTIGEQKLKNYALRHNMSKEEFVVEVTDGLLPPPAYFGMNVAMNKKGLQSFETVLSKGMNPINVLDFENTINETEALILDTRNNGEFSKGHIPNSISIGISGDFAPWVGALIANVEQQIVIVTEIGKEEETITRLSRVGFDNVNGYLDGGFEAWQKAGFEIDTIHRITSEQFAKETNTKKDKIIDLRRDGEYEAEHVDEAYSKPLANINEWINQVNPDEHFYIYCAGGYRSMIAASILQTRGYRNFTEIEGGFNAISKTDVPKTNFICQSKLLNL